MTPHLPPTARPLALLAAGLVLATAACGGSSGPGGPTPGPTATVTETRTAPASSPAGVPATSSPRVRSATATPPGGGDGACTAADLRVRYADDPGGAGAGNVTGTFTFTNRSSGDCTLRGFPGVSYVAGSAGEQVGQAATRTDEKVVTTRLRAGGSAEASLRRSQPRGYGEACDETDVRGFRVYAPGDTAAVFVSFATTGCRSASAPLLQVGPVR